MPAQAHPLRALRVSLRMCGLLAIVSLLAPQPASAQQPTPAARAVTITGFVRDANTGSGIAGVLVTIREQGPRALTDSLGAFRLPNVAVGPQRVSAERIGYAPLVLPVQVADPPQTLELRIVPLPIPLEGLVVSGDARLALSGRVLDARTLDPIPWTSLWLTPDATRPAAAGSSDANGAFTLPEVPVGPYLLRARVVGYVSQYVPVLVSAPLQAVELRLEPDSLVLAGLPVLKQEFRARRNRSRGIAVAYDAERLLNSGARHAFEFLARNTWARPVPCERGPGFCLAAENGRVVQPIVILDEVRLCGGDALDVLSTYRPDELYLIEVFGFTTIRAYTHDFIERGAIKQALDPHWLQPSRGCS